MSEKWLSDRIAYINGLKNPSLTQKTLIELHNIPEHERTPTNTKHLNTLIKAERTADRAASAQRAAKKIFTEEQAKNLQLEMMVSNNTATMETAFTVSVDYKIGTTTGVSASDRSKTIQALVFLLFYSLV